MAASLNARQLVSRVRNRSRITAAQAYLSLRWRLGGGLFWIDHGCIKLPFHGDGDRQELYYHLDGKKWWDKELRLISPYLRSGGVAVDVGANLGFMSGILSVLTGVTGQVHSFEPSPSVYPKLVAVIDANRYTNVSSYNVGCGKEEQSITLYSPMSSGNATMRPDARLEQTAKERQTVHIVNLDDFLGPKLENLNFLKIDAEGFEDEVLSGAVGLLRKFMPIVYIELSSQHRASSEKAVSILLDQGYSFDRELSLDNAFLGDNFFALPPDSSAHA